MGDIRGYCAVIINPNGDVVAEATDFAPSEAAGFSNASRQKDRAQSRVELAFARNHLNQWLARKIDGYFAGRFFEHAQKCGYKLHIFPIGEASHD
ncbi:hypothetical protein [Castellaniella sp.]|uniref:hypothetical protein n=1 Tax=Castellaniella sp. TaxID=1955812 RepID=UPI002AFEDF7F|nr:hypothetical protein [Castellaniella sp.]